MAHLSAVLQVEGLHWATSSGIIEKTLLRRAGVVAVEAHAVAQTATVTYEPDATSVADFSRWIRDCGYHCAGRSLPLHVCDPMLEPAEDHEHAMPAEHTGHGGPMTRSPQEVMGHGGHHGGMSMDAMVRDMRDRFLVAAVFSVPILMWSPIGRDVLGLAGLPRVLGMRDDVCALPLSLPVVGWSAARTLCANLQGILT